MSKAPECFLDVAGEREFDRSLSVVPPEVHAAEVLACPVDDDLVFLLEMVDEVGDVCLISYLTPKSSTMRQKVMGLVL